MNVVNYEIRGLTSPLEPIVQYNNNSRLKHKQARPICNCEGDSDDMAPECAFICDQVAQAVTQAVAIAGGRAHSMSRKRRSHVKKSHTKKMK